MTFRKTVFWLHLAAGMVAGLVIGIMSFTGAALAFEKEIIAWAERDARRVDVPPAAQRLPLDALVQRLREAAPDARPSTIVLSADPTVAVTFAAGRDATYYANPYTGEIHIGTAAVTRAFMRTMNAWHRTLGVEGGHRTLARAVTGAANAAFLVLALSGLYLWWPRTWSRQALRAVATLKFSLRGKARDFNWHNAVGFWSAPVLIVVTATALPISYRWAGDLIYTLTGTEAPSQGAGPGVAGSPATVAPRADDATPMSRDALVAAAAKTVPTWSQITVRLTGGRGEAGPRGAGRAGNEARGSRVLAAGSQPFVVSIKQPGTWPRTAATTVMLDPFTGAVLQREGFADQNRGRQVRSWARFLHTGEALGWVGQLVAGAASLGGVLLVWTGFTLAWRRLLGMSSRRAGFSEAASGIRTAVTAEAE